MKPLFRSLIGCGALALPAFVQGQDNPSIIFITENGAAKAAIEKVVAEEYNALQKEELRTTDLEAYDDYNADDDDVSFRNIPADFRNSRYDEIKTALGLADDDPADLGFTQMLEAAGYDVHRTTSTFEEDPFTGAITEDHEFWPDIGGRDPDIEDEFKLSQEQIDRLNAADLIIFSPDTSHDYYARGRTAGEADYSLRDQWLGLETPIIMMNHRLIISHPWDNWGWGLTYGYGTQIDAVSATDRRNTDPRFAFPDLRPQVVDGDPDILSGVTPVDDQRVAVYKDYAEFPELPVNVRKFGNLANFSFGSNVDVVLELQIPTFFDVQEGEIGTRDPVVLEFAAGLPGFQVDSAGPQPIQPEKVGTPNSTVVYFAAGMAGTGLHNLSETGEQVFLNTVEKLTGGAVARTWHGYTVDADGMVDTGEWMGQVYVDNDPWIYVYELGGYVYMEDDSGWLYVPN